jgi:hypothetical protein
MDHHGKSKKEHNSDNNDLHTLAEQRIADLYQKKPDFMAAPETQPDTNTNHLQLEDIVKLYTDSDEGGLSHRRKKEDSLNLGDGRTSGGARGVYGVSSIVGGLCLVMSAVAYYAI